MVGCTLCDADLGTLRGREINYRLERREPFERIGELCIDCGQRLFEEGAEATSCCDCDDGEFHVTRLRLTRVAGSSWSRTPEETRGVLCSMHFRERTSKSAVAGASDNRTRQNSAAKSAPRGD